MRKILCTLVLLACVVGTYAQSFYPIPFSNNGTYTIAGNDITVRKVGNAGHYYACGTGPFVIGRDGKNTGYHFTFAQPVLKVRARMTGVNEGEELSFYVNGVFYALKPADLGPYGGTCVGSPMSGVTHDGKLTGLNTGIQSHALVEISSTIPIDSVLVFSAKDTQAGSHFTFEFLGDPKLSVIQPYTDTLKCTSDSLFIKFHTTARMNDNNRFFAELSDETGSFASPITIGYVDTMVDAHIPCKLPENIKRGAGYRVRITSNSPVRTSPDNGKDIRITTYPSPVLNSNSPLCEGDTLELSAVEEPATKYYWTGPHQFISNQGDPKIYGVGINSAGRYVVSATLYGCKVVDTITVNVLQRPSVWGVRNTGPVCDGESFSLHMESNALDSMKYYWYSTTGFTSETKNPTIDKAGMGQNGVYMVYATRYGCRSNTDTTTVVIKPRPAIPEVSNDGPKYPGDTIILTGSNPPDVTFEWKSPTGEIISTEHIASLNSITKKDEGEYTYSVSIAGCGTSAKTYVKLLPRNFFRVHPNPNNGTFSVKINVHEDQEVGISMIDLLGRVVYKTKEKTENNVLQKKITVNTKLPPGIYMLRITMDNENTDMKMFITD